MNLSAFLDPVKLQDTPRFFTAIAEWLAVFVYFNIYKRRHNDYLFVIQCVLTFALLTLFQFIAGLLSLSFWIPAMIGAVALMYVSLYEVLDIKPKDCGVLTTHAFVLAEFAASLYNQLYVWIVRFIDQKTIMGSFFIMAVVYAITYSVYFKIERGNIAPNRNLNVNNRELISVVITGIGCFIMSNLSFVSSRTPFSATENMLYVRTLVDFGGMLMLMTQMGRRNELTLRNESNEINQLFQKQYEQYKLAVDNSEALRKEMHDMKHYLMALKNEDDPARRAEVLEDMEQSIAIQESFMNTGNKVLDVILTTKSLQCQKKNITLNAMVDGDLLADIHVKDICSLFGNILDNAIEATQQVENEEKRLITLSVRRRNQFIIVECENYSEGTNVRLRSSQRKRIFRSNNLPQTSKADNVKHGFGLKSINQVAEKYGGAMNCSYDDGWFKVKVLLANKNS
ncbi:sensor histidine kinase [Pseudobutyrivibrio xylanivorans]|uniref:GHKL domain-containing protein n=1 Tax=Pseudobutyrivibrio xylanivorans DSM 14809 TaxID=1123012 RepID=A0A1M6DRN0_PSEXY|nr:GHKL domain-containing protein [Pseudobutyrivibrio xylanivorans]SHI75668.1 GHKL domain-containing protein [Pseudobutyrivibrio xylanivorans DSM 14809]